MKQKQHLATGLGESERVAGGEGGIRTPDGVAPMPHFECGVWTCLANFYIMVSSLSALRTNSDICVSLISPWLQQLALWPKRAGHEHGTPLSCAAEQSLS